MVFLMNMSGKCTPRWEPPWCQNFFGNVPPLMGPRNHEIFFPDMFIERVWKNTCSDLISRKTTTPTLKRGQKIKRDLQIY